jgi:hypothetical protein
MSYCPRCRSRLFPDDAKYISKAGVCSYCVTYDNTPDKRFQRAFHGDDHNIDREGRSYPVADYGKRDR